MVSLGAVEVAVEVEAGWSLDGSTVFPKKGEGADLSEEGRRRLTAFFKAEISRLKCSHTWVSLICFEPGFQSALTSTLRSPIGCYPVRSGQQRLSRPSRQGVPPIERCSLSDGCGSFEQRSCCGAAVSVSTKALCILPDCTKKYGF